MIYLIETPYYYKFISSPIPEKLASKPQFIRYFNLESDYSIFDD